jgi:transposase
VLAEGEGDRFGWISAGLRPLRWRVERTFLPDARFGRLPDSATAAQSVKRNRPCERMPVEIAPLSGDFGG